MNFRIFQKGGFIILKTYFEEILKNYNDLDKKINNENPIYQHITENIREEIKNRIKESEDMNNIYKIKGFSGQTYKSSCPFIRITFEENSKKLEKEFYVCYLFQADMSGFYLTLCLAVENDRYPENASEKNLKKIEEDKTNFKKSILSFSNTLGVDLNFEEFDNFNSESNINLNCPKEKDCKRPKKYEKSVVFSKHYECENVPEDSELFNDLKKILEIYEFTIKYDIYNKFRKNNRDVSCNFNQYLRDYGYCFDQKTITNFLLSLKTKPFVILTGNSGTGKTKLAQSYARFIDYLYYGIFNEYHNSFYEVISVGANWTDNRNLLGYENIITKSYHHTPALDLILRSKDDKENPYFLILDEMNLSRVERYFSDFLSAMESGDPIPLYEKDEDKNYDIPNKLEIPKNLFIIGTVNVDETTYMFSPKVLDRANVVEFETIDTKSYINWKNSEIENIEYLQDIMNSNNSNSEELKKIKLDNNSNLYAELLFELDNFYQVLKGSGFEFGIRTIKEIQRFMVEAASYEKKNIEKNWKCYFDAQIKQKILPKLHGSEIELKETIRNLLKLCIYTSKIREENNGNIDILEVLNKKELNKEIRRKIYENPEKNDCYIESAKKLDKMLEFLEKEKYVSFIG